MKAAKPSRRKSAGAKLEPIDWHEFANDAVLNGNMSTLYHRPTTEDPTSYASQEALLEIERRTGNRVSAPVVEFSREASFTPTVGLKESEAAAAAVVSEPEPEPVSPSASCVFELSSPSEDEEKKKFKAITGVQDALTLAGQVLYKAMYGAPDGGRSKSCTKGYRQLAAETHLDKDTVRDLICEFKEKGIVREVSSYNPDTRLSKTYEVLSYKSILQLWREAGLGYVTLGRRRPSFCTAEGVPVVIPPTVGLRPTVPYPGPDSISRPTVGAVPTVGVTSTEQLLEVLSQTAAVPVDQEAADRLVRNCRAQAADCTLDEIIEFVLTKATLCRSGKIDNPIGFLITQVPKHFEGELLAAHRERKRRDAAIAAELQARAEVERRALERELAEVEERQRQRRQIMDRHRTARGIDLAALLKDSDADAVSRDWAQRMLKAGHHYQAPPE